ncbi:MAG: DUF2141 domain-containing protein [Bacteroidota bacterium]
MIKFFIGVLLLFLSCSIYAQTGTVIFKVSGIQADKGGELSAGIFEKANFPKVGQQLKGTEKAVSSNYSEVTLTDVPVGTYGAVVFQDINKNKDLETNVLGYPKEPIGFANGAKIRFGPPAFEDSTIQVLANKTTEVIIKLK